VLRPERISGRRASLYLFRIDDVDDEQRWIGIYRHECSWCCNHCGCDCAILREISKAYTKEVLLCALLISLLRVGTSVMALSLSFAAGVMLFVSFVSIFPKSLESWRAVAAVGPPFAMLAASGCFFGGIGGAILVDLVVHRIDRHGLHSHSNANDDSLRTLLTNRADETTDEQSHTDANDDSQSSLLANRTGVEEAAAVDAPTAEPEGSQTRDDLFGLTDAARRTLRQMGLMIAVAMVIHNIPEGIAAYAGTLADPRVGIGLSVAIALHNIPAGICIAMPIFYATGSCWKGVALAAAVGACEPIGALIAYAFLSGQDNSLAFGIVFGFVSGMLAHIAIHESLPTAKRNNERLSTFGFIAGLTIMAFSLALFDFV
jgi:ZIP family zinc transporter